MKHFISIAAAAMALLLPHAMMGEEKYVFTDAAGLSVCGKICENTFEQYSRLPESLHGVTREAVWKLGRNSAGIYVRFCSDAGSFRFKWTSVLDSFLDNVSLIATRGMALYVREGKEWMYVGTARPSKKSVSSKYTISCTDLEGSQHEYMLYLSLYDGVKDLEIGVPEGRYVRKPELALPANDRPVILYGTSITQGASASNPGMAGSNILSRMLDRTVINLGFSGNGMLDPEMAQLMASYPDPAAYVIDNWNGNAEIGRERLDAFIATLRKAHPTTPIVMMDRAMAPGCRFNKKQMDEFLDKAEVIEKEYRKLRKAGDKHVWHLSPYILGYGNSSTIDGAHFTDEGFVIWARDAWSVLKKVCK